jgi:hypothetical protein
VAPIFSCQFKVNPVELTFEAVTTGLMGVILSRALGADVDDPPEVVIVTAIR